MCRGRNVPTALEGNLVGLSLNIESATLETELDSLYEFWSNFATAHGEVAIFQKEAAAIGSTLEVPDEFLAKRSRELKVALRRSAQFTKTILKKLSYVNMHNYDAAPDVLLRRWLASDQGPIVVSHHGVSIPSIPWHLTYIGDEKIDRIESPDDVPEIAAQDILGMKRRVVHQVSIGDASDLERLRARPPFNGVPDGQLLTVGTSIPITLAHTKKPSQNDVGQFIFQTMRKQLPTVSMTLLTTAAMHEIFLAGNKPSSYNGWLIVTHGAQDSRPKKQRSLQVDNSNTGILNVGHLHSRITPMLSFEHPIGVFMLACRSGILGPEWDIPQHMILMGAAVVIAPHADIDFREGLDLHEAYFSQYAMSGITPSDAFVKAKQRGTIYGQLHANLFTEIVGDFKVITSATAQDNGVAAR